MNHYVMENMDLIVFTTLGFLLGWWAFHRLLRANCLVWTIWDHQSGLHYRNGQFVKRLKAGKHRLWGSGNHVYTYDNRYSELVVQGQEVMVSDGTALKVSVVARWRIVDPEKFHLAALDAEKALYTTVQFALRQIVGRLGIDEVIEQKDSLGEEMFKLVNSEQDRLGVEVGRVDVRDVMLSGELKVACQKVLTARKEALAELEKAWGEAAALRTLANASRLLEKNPDLMQMKYLETIREVGTGGYGNTLVVGLPDDLAGFARKE